jgi:beta-phosphoglucomutase-like phosphatase (HAD superfamily)
VSSRFDPVIFDCDGVLVDSERLIVRTEARILSHLGWPLTEADIVERFVGRSAAHMRGEVERHLGRSVDWEVEFEARYRDVLARELVAVDGVVEALDAIAATTCVASSGSYEKMDFTLGLTGLRDRFAERIFSADDVVNGNRHPTSSSTPPGKWVTNRSAAPSSKTASPASPRGWPPE